MNFFIAGVDEAGRGPLAGPVTAACVCLPPDYLNKAIKDSKKLSAALREDLFLEINREAIACAVVSVGHQRIAELNILGATKLAMWLAAKRVESKLCEQFGPSRVYYLIDGNASLGNKIPHETIIKGDDKIQAIAAASILAKVSRDHLMELLDLRYPNYEFRKHKGYGTESHRQKIKQFGPSLVHRASFQGVKEHLQQVFSII